MYKSILLPVDLNEKSSWKKTLPVAAKMAQEDGAKLHILTVIPDYGTSMVASFFPADYVKNAMAETEKALSTFVEANVPPKLSAEGHVRHGTIYKEIIQAADGLGCDLIILASHRPEGKDYLLGPNAARVARHAEQSVFVVRNN